MNNKGFTLIELLSVIVIMGIIAAISIPLVGNIQDKNSKDNYEYFEGMIKEAMMLYEDQYMPRYDDATNCVKIDYDKLVSTGLIKEENFKCNGTILGERNKNNGFNYEYYLDCVDEKDNVVSENEKNLPVVTCDTNSSLKKYTIIFDANGGTTPTATKRVTEGSTYGSLPVPTRKGGTFLGWFTEKEEGTQITADTKVDLTNNQVLYARWELVSAAQYIMDLAETNTHELRIDNGYRYYGATPNNYVEFNGEMWRIIGVFNVDDGTGNAEKRVKIIRDASRSASFWDSRIGATNRWERAGLQYTLNNSYYNSLTTEAKEFIGNAKWYLSPAPRSASASAFYRFEREVTEEQKVTVCYSSTYCVEKVILGPSWTGKVGLIYPSDFGYASDLSVCDEDTHLDEYRYVSSCASTNWLYTLGAQWTITPSMETLSDKPTVFCIGGGPGLWFETTDTSRPNRPVVYLSADVKITGGTGEKGENAFKLSK